MDTNFKMFLILTRLILAFSLIKIVFSSSQIPLVDPDSTSLTDRPFPSDVEMLFEVMGMFRGISCFAGITRNVPHIANRLKDGITHKIVLAPSNSAIAAMSHKPWENPVEYNTLGSEAYEGDEGKERADQNLKKFVESHFLPLSPWPENTKVESLAGGTKYWWYSKDGGRIIQPGDIQVNEVLTSAKEDDGELWIIEGVLN